LAILSTLIVITAAAIAVTYVWKDNIDNTTHKAGMMLYEENVTL
jgi:uncharacterized protein (UPF0333 family)